MTEAIFEKLKNTIIDGDTKAAVKATQDAIKNNVPIKEILSNGLISGIRIVGELFNKGEYFLPELISGGKAMQAALEEINPLLQKLEKNDSNIPGRFLIGTVKGDMHDIGKLIVVMMLKSNRWEVTDLGIDIPPEKFCDAVKEGNFDVVGMSCLLTMTMPQAAMTIKALEDAGLRKNIKIMVGGAPVTQEAATKMGADGYGENAWEAVTAGETLLMQLRKERMKI
jgi:methylmalonyl-CoA mutase cobalamin-binding domain/chain